MLKLMRDSFHQLKWILLAIVASFIFGFVFVNMGLGGAAVSGRKDTSAFAARVNGETISYNDYYRQLKNYEEMYRQMYGGQFTPEMMQALRLPTQAMDSLIDQRLLWQEAKRLNLEATPEEVRRKLLTIDVFNPEGKFVGMELYTRYVTGPMGYSSAADFEQELARDIAVTKVESALTGSIVISPKTADAEYRRANENAKIKFVLLPATQAAANVTVTPAEVDAYYRNNQAKYTHGEQRKVRYLLADLTKLRSQVTPSDSELRKRYEESKDQFKTNEAAHVLHILIKVDPSAPPAVDAAARAKAQSLVAQLRAGADFAKLAQENSEDPSSAGKGGGMEWVERGATVEPFDQAIFTIPLNTISDPIRSKEFGYHIVKILGRRPAGVRSFEEVRPMLTARVVNDMVKEQSQAEMDRVSTMMRTKQPKSIEEFTAFANDKVTSNDTGWVQKGDQIPGMGAHQPLQEWIFSAKNNDVSPIIGTPRGPVIAMLESVRPSGVSSLQDIREKVEEDARQAKASELARTMLAQMMLGASSIDQVAQKVGTPVRDTEVNRQSPVSGLSGDTSTIIETAMSSHVGELKGPVSVKEGAVAFQIVDQKKVTDQEIAQNRATFLNTLRQNEARSLRSSLLKRLRESSKIEKNEELLRPPTEQAGV